MSESWVKDHNTLCYVSKIRYTNASEMQQNPRINFGSILYLIMIWVRNRIPYGSVAVKRNFFLQIVKQQHKLQLPTCTFTYGGKSIICKVSRLGDAIPPPSPITCPRMWLILYSVSITDHLVVYIKETIPTKWYFCHCVGLMNLKAWAVDYHYEKPRVWWFHLHNVDVVLLVLLSTSLQL